MAVLPPFQSLLDAHGDEIHRFLRATAGPVEADDCWQETWLAALRAYPSLSDASNLRGWLFTIAHRKVIDAARARARRATPVAEPAELAGAARTRVDAEPSPANSDLSATDGELWPAVAALPPKQRTALALRYIADWAYAEIAAAMATSEAAARRNVHEALTRLSTEVVR
ncbi:MAG: RNA polymerase sigma factor [Solirubrobacteraceae bacterium]